MTSKGARILALALVALLAFAFVPAATAQDETLEDEIEAAVVAGLEWLADQQNPDGSFGSYEKVAHTGVAILKFEDRAIDLGYDPLDPDYEYFATVEAGLDYIAGEASTQPIGIEPTGDPDGDGDGIGVYWHSGYEYHQIYNTGTAMMALAASGHPELYGDLVQDAVDYLAWAQVDPECGVHRGGWRYGPDECDSDNSNSGYATLGLGFAAASPPFGFEVPIPPFVFTELDVWIGVMQDPVDGDADDGGSWYDPYYPWVNILKTGNLLYEMGLVGDTATTPRVLDAVDYIERHWGDTDYCGAGWLGHRQAMFTMMKGLDALGIDLLDLDGVGDLDDWFAEVASHLIATQDPGGWWPVDCWGNEILSTAWALLTLERAVPVFEIPVAFDVHPTSCRNPINVDSKGVTPAAILGTAEFDVTQVDPGTLLLEGVSPLRWSYEDVATPYEPYLGKVDAYDCTTEGPDGFMDLTVKFKTAELAAALGEVNDGEVLIVTITGMLMEEYGGTPIIGEDVIVILRK